MTETSRAARIYLIRHATPDWSRIDIPYDVPPGPSLIDKGEKEAAQLGEFLHQAGVKKLVHSPLERAKATARISAQIAGILHLEEDDSLAEWRHGESEQQVSTRFQPVWNRLVSESKELGPLGLVSHGGPLGLLLTQLGLPAADLAAQRKIYDHGNPLPPAGVWLAERARPTDQWILTLVFSPQVSI